MAGAITLVGGLVCAAVGTTVMAAWLTRTTALLRVGGQNPMAFNTALALAVTGAALVLIPRQPIAALVAGVFDTALGMAVLAEFALGRSLGIDQLAVTAYISGPGSVPGRAAASTAVCLTAAGAALLAWSPWRPRPRPAALAAAGSLIAAIAVIASFGYATGTPAAYGWGHLTAMAVLTAATLLILAASLLSAAWRSTPIPHGGFPPWLPVPAAVLAFGLASAVWLVIAASDPAAGRITGAVTVLGLAMAALVALVVWLAQQVDTRRRVALAEAARRAKAEREARESQRQLFQFLDAMPVGVFVALPGGRPYYANHEAERVLGRGAVPDADAAELAENYDVFVAGTDRPYPAESLPVVRAFRGEPSHIHDQEIHHPDGTVIPLEVWSWPVYGTGGDVDYAVSAFADMSERNAKEKTIASQAALLELAHDAIFVRDRSGRIVYWNAGAEHTYGFTRAEAIGRISHEILRTRSAEPIAGIEATTDQDGHWEGELTQQRADGQVIIVESRWAAQRAPDGRLANFMEVNRDITARKDAEHEIRRRAEEVQTLNVALEHKVQQRTVHLEQANKNLEAFTYSVAHDLRSPLRALNGFAEALMEEYAGRLGETGRGYVRRIQTASEHMATLIDNLLHLSRVSRADMNLQDVDLSAEVTDICEQLRARDPSRRARTTIKAGIRATADRNLIRTALENLLENAWKFTAGRDDATIEFATTPTADAPLCCYIRDNGAGFDPVYTGKLFQPFQRLHTTHEFPGTGIGLASVRRIIERHNGQVWAEGAIGHGATIYFTLNATNTP